MLIDRAISAFIASVLIYLVYRWQKQLPYFDFLDPFFIVTFTAMLTFVDSFGEDNFELGRSVIKAFVFSSVLAVVVPLLVRFIPYPVGTGKSDRK